MTLKKSSTSSTAITILICLILIGIMSYMLSIFWHAGPLAHDFADMAYNKLTTGSVTDISFITYDMLEDYFQQRITFSEFEKLRKQEAPDAYTFEIYKRISDTPQEPDLIQRMIEFTCGIPEKPVEAIVEVKALKYRVSHSITFSVEHFTYKVKVIKWDIEVERLSYSPYSLKSKKKTA